MSTAKSSLHYKYVLWCVGSEVIIEHYTLESMIIMSTAIYSVCMYMLTVHVYMLYNYEYMLTVHVNKKSCYKQTHV